MFEEKYGTAKRRLKSEDFSSNTNNENLKINNNCIGDFILGIYYYNNSLISNNYIQKYHNYII